MRILTPLRRKILAAGLASCGLMLWGLAVMVVPPKARDVTYPHIEARVLAIVGGGASITGGIIMLLAAS